MLHFAQWLSVLLRFCFQSFSLRYALKNTLEKNFFNLCLTSFLCLLHFVLLSVFALTSPRKTNYLSILYGHLQAVCWGISRKFYKKIAENFSRQPHIKRKSDITQTSFFFFGYWYLIFYAMSLLLNVAIAIKNKNAVIEIANKAVVKTLLTVKDVKDFSNCKLSGKSHFTKFAILPLVDYCFLKTSFIIFVNFGGVP